MRGDVALWWDVMRLVVIVTGVLTLALVWLIWSAYCRNHPAESDVKKHVRRVTIMGAAFPLYGTIEVLTLLGDPLTPRAPALFLLFIITVWSLLPLYGAEVRGSEQHRPDPFEGV